MKNKKQWYIKGRQATFWGESMISQNYTPILTPHIPKEQIYKSINKFAKSLGRQKNSLIITNLSKNYLSKKQFFCLVITSKKIIFRKKVRSKKITFIYLTKDNSLKLNKKTCSYQQLLTFMKCMELTLAKLVSGEVKIYRKV